VKTSKKLTPLGIGLCVLMIVGSVLLGRAINPFESAFSKVVFSAFLGGLAGFLGVTLSHMFSFTHTKIHEDE
jgi:FtsH-binding integral membrane protein